MKQNPHQEEQRNNENQENALCFQEPDNVDIVNGGSSHKIGLAILGIIIEFLVGRGRKPYARAFSGEQSFLNFGTAQVIFHRLHVGHKAVVQNLAGHINYGEPRIGYRQQNFQSIERLEIAGFKYFFVLDVPVRYFRNIIQNIFELSRPVTFFTIVLISQYRQGKNEKNDEEVNKYSAAKSALYNHFNSFYIIKYRIRNTKCRTGASMFSVSYFFFPNFRNSIRNPTGL
jgi:hypothetical protein